MSDHSWFTSGTPFAEQIQSVLSCMNFLNASLLVSVQHAQKRVNKPGVTYSEMKDSKAEKEPDVKRYEITRRVLENPLGHVIDQVRV